MGGKSFKKPKILDHHNRQCVLSKKYYWRMALRICWRQEHQSTHPRILKSSRLFT
ncbi:similar to low density lipoprotein receptor-related protein binding protein (predicted), isoform CRA_c [Rattus norvegicus]|uniref:Similar to low density lipoprotein receptor-related protein binding protein (Predicted), isoform CRA_c n=1 Tax=Rattus norvegicus TaxID=10116 RepID=A6JPP9_RAT|nr:similar to low density lipoprotein receptor-related protein binding protein (predicted), isoform CRA_c [Rattus norvegicus]